MINKEERIIFVTHENPDLDACMAIWLLERFKFQGRECLLKFAPVGKKLSESDGGTKIIYVDTGGSKYDHHNINDYVCAASLVMEDLDLQGDAAIRRMVEYTLKIDHGELFEVDVGDFNLVNIIEGLNILYANNDDKLVTIIGLCLDGIYESLKEEVEAETEFKKIYIFETKWGKGAGISTNNRKVRYLCHRRGFKVFVYIDPKNRYRGFTSPGGGCVDFSVLFGKLKKLEPDADWFLHSSKELLLCGSSKARDRNLSSLSLDEMINMIKLQTPIKKRNDNAS